MESKREFWARIALFSAALIWGGSFVVVKSAVDDIGTNYLLAMRFSTACVILLVIFMKRLKKTDLRYIVRGGILGALLYSAYLTQTLGITTTTPGKNAFLTAVYVVLVPFIYWLTSGKRPDIFNFIAAGGALLGIGLVSLGKGFAIGIGDSLTLLGGLFYALHMIFVARFTQHEDADAVLLTIYQFAFCGLFSLTSALLFEEMPVNLNMQTLWGIGFLAIFATALCLLLQNVGQKYTPPAAASILLSLESVFGVLFSVLCGTETLSLRITLGFAVIFVSVLISETKLSFLSLPKRGRAEK